MNIFAKLIRAVNEQTTVQIMKRPSAKGSQNPRMYVMVVTREPTAGKVIGITKHKMQITSTSSNSEPAGRA